jgi:hypothetical protein
MTLPNSLKAGLYTAAFSFITLFGAALTGWLNDFVMWASSDGATAIPDGSTLAKAAAAAAGASLIGLVNFVLRWAGDRTGIGPETPTYTPPGSGAL